MGNKAIKQQLAKLLEAEMDRKSFLKTTAVTAVALSGVFTVFKTVSASIPSAAPAKSLAQSQPSAYGMASYGKTQLS